MFRLTKQLTLGSKRCLKRECRRGVMSNRQLKKRVPVKQIHDELAKQRQMEENPRPLQFTPDGDVSKLPFSIRRSGPAQNLPVYLGMRAIIFSLSFDDEKYNKFYTFSIFRLQKRRNESRNNST